MTTNASLAREAIDEGRDGRSRETGFGGDLASGPGSRPLQDIECLEIRHVESESGGDGAVERDGRGVVLTQREQYGRITRQVRE